VDIVMVASTEKQERYIDHTDIDPEAIRFIQDHRVKTKAAATHAAGVAERIRNGEAGELDEMTLFTALQTCAYRAARQPRGKRVAASERMEWAGRWKMIRDFIVEQNLGLVYAMITRFGAKDLDWDEQRSEALFALVRAVDGFNPWTGFRLSTYACNAITRSLIHLSKRTTSQRLRFPIEHEAWLERPTREDGWSELFADRLRHALSENLGDLTDREAAVLGWRFPLNGGRSLTLGEIGEAIGLSKERARQIQEIALDKLRVVLTSDPALQ
jgi:RNA polymerase sigma factor (sigma-70 family)